MAPTSRSEGTHPAIVAAAAALAALALFAVAAWMGWFPGAPSVITPASVAMPAQQASGGVASEYSLPELPACANCGTVASVDKKAVWEVRVKLEDGTNRSVKFTAEPAFRVGDRVRLEGATLVRD